jgi:hypothetical protein
MSRTCLTTDTTYYAASGGSDTTGDGSSENPFATPNHMISKIQAEIDLCGKNVIFQLSGTACQPFTITGPFVGAKSAHSVKILGNVSSPSSKHISSTSYGPAVTVTEGAKVTLQGFKLSAPSGSVPMQGSAIQVINGAHVFLAGITFGGCMWAHIHALHYGQVTYVGGNLIVQDGASYGFLAEDKSQMNFNGATLSYEATTGYGYAFVEANQSSCIDFIGTSFAYNGNTVVGKRYITQQNALIRTGGNTLPGNTVGDAPSYGNLLS